MIVNQNINFSIAEQSNAIGVQDLNCLISSIPRPKSYWSWINFNNAYPENIVIIGKQAEQIVAHYAISVRKFLYLGEEIRVGLATQTMIHPKFRNLDNLIQLSETVQTLSKQKKLSFLVGFPNNNLFKINTKLLGWKQIKDIYQYERKLEDSIVDSKIKNIVRVFEFDDRFNDLLENYNEKTKLIFEPLTKTKLNWRYFEHPLNNYFVFGHLENNIFNGYIVIKFYHGLGGLTSHFIELRSKNNDKNILNKLLTKSYQFIVNQGCYSNSVWPDENLDIFEFYGYKPNSIKSNFQISAIDNLNLNFLKGDNWSVSMKMSDAY